MNPQEKESGPPPVPATNSADKGKRILESESSQPNDPAVHIGEHLFKFSNSMVEDETTILKLFNEFLYHNPGVDPSSKSVLLHDFIEKSTWQDVNRIVLTGIISKLEKDYWGFVDENGDLKAGVIEESFENFNPQVFDLSQKIWDQKHQESFFDYGNFLFKNSKSSFEDNFTILKFLYHFFNTGEGFDPSVHSDKLHGFFVRTAKEYVSPNILSHRVSKLKELYSWTTAELIGKFPHLQTDQKNILHKFSKKIWGSKDDDQDKVIIPEDRLEMARDVAKLDLPDDRTILKLIVNFMARPPRSWCSSLHHRVKEWANVDRIKLMHKILYLERKHGYSKEHKYEVNNPGEINHSLIFNDEEMELADRIWAQEDRA